MSTAGSLGPGQQGRVHYPTPSPRPKRSAPAYQYIHDDRYPFDEASNRYMPHSSPPQNYYYPTISINGQGGQIPQSMHQSYQLTQQTYQIQDPRYVAHQTNQTLTALASVRRFPHESRMDPNAQVGDANRGSPPYYPASQRDYYPPAATLPPASSPYPTGISGVPKAPLSATQNTHAIVKTSEGHACSYCGKTFGRPSAVKIHMAIHTGERAFTCPAPGCHRSFSVRSNMSRHIRNVHQSWPYHNETELDEAVDVEDHDRY